MGSRVTSPEAVGAVDQTREYIKGPLARELLPTNEVSTPARVPREVETHVEQLGTIAQIIGQSCRQ